MRWSRHVSRQHARIGNMTKSIPIIGWLPVNWSDVGMRDWSMFARLKSGSLNRTQSRPPHLVPRIANACLHSAQTCPEPGIARERLSRRGKGLSGY